jgi:hypothetical protein
VSVNKMYTIERESNQIWKWESRTINHFLSGGGWQLRSIGSVGM